MDTKDKIEEFIDKCPYDFFKLIRLKNIDKDDIPYETYIYAFKAIQNKETRSYLVNTYLIHVPLKMRDKEMCIEAVKTGFINAKYVPKNIIDEEIAIEALKFNSRALTYIYKSIKTPEFISKCYKNGYIKKGQIRHDYRDFVLGSKYKNEISTYYKKKIISLQKKIEIRNERIELIRNDIKDINEQISLLLEK